MTHAQINTLLATLGPLLVLLVTALVSKRSASEKRVEQLEDVVYELRHRRDADDEYIGILRRHIWDGKPPPPPDRPEY